MLKQDADPHWQIDHDRLCRVSSSFYVQIKVTEQTGWKPETTICGVGDTNGNLITLPKSRLMSF